MQPFQADHDSIDRNARQNLAKGAVTAGNDADVAEVIDALNHALATELVCELRYRAHYHAADDEGELNVAGEFLEHAQQERAHGEKLAARIAQLGGQPDFNPSTLLERSHADYTKPGSIDKMLEDNLVAERQAIQVYTKLIRWLGDHDPTSRRLIEEILEQEEEHADDLAGLRKRLSTRSRGNGV
ncbi:MAG: bacterioferritin [Deltaproteobacteria bacterium]|nr:bacterioferritin [Deltaproteobacteria bacterium]